MKPCIAAILCHARACSLMFEGYSRFPRCTRERIPLVLRSLPPISRRHSPTRFPPCSIPPYAHGRTGLLDYDIPPCVHGNRNFRCPFGIAAGLVMLRVVFAQTARVRCTMRRSLPAANAVAGSSVSTMQQTSSMLSIRFFIGFFSSCSYRAGLFCPPFSLIFPVSEPECTAR